MAEPLKNSYGPEVPRRIAAMISAVHPGFPAAAFLRDALDGYAGLELMPRGRQIAGALGKHLPREFPAAARILIDSLGPELDETMGNGMSPFLYLPHGYFISSHGLGHFTLSMDALHALTRRFTAEFAIRPFLDVYPREVMEVLEAWTSDPSVHVRRLVSEGTRPRLPWAPRLHIFGKDPGTMLPLLSRLRDDPEEYVRRSVANHLNDIGKSHPGLLVDIATAWTPDAPPPRRRLIAHALRSLVKSGDPGALSALGFTDDDAKGLKLDRIRITPSRPHIGGRIAISFRVTNTSDRKRRVLVDCRVHFVKANGRSSPKVFKIKTTELEPDSGAEFSKSLSLAPMTTRVLYPGVHRIDAQINGQLHRLGGFTLG
jgi:3-methyladenine DNA glycosylase AlkC